VDAALTLGFELPTRIPWAVNAGCGIGLDRWDPEADADAEVETRCLCTSLSLSLSSSVSRDAEPCRSLLGTCVWLESVPCDSAAASGNLGFMSTCGEYVDETAGLVSP